MTEAQFTSFIKSALRSKSRFWKPVSDTIKNARIARGVYVCNVCKQQVPKSIMVNGKRRNNIICDHIVPVVPPSNGFTDWNTFIENLFCEQDNLQAICLACDTDKQALERAARQNNKKETQDDETTI